MAGAKPLYEEALALQRAGANRPAGAIMLTNLGILAFYQNDLPTARRRLEESLALRTEAGHRSDQSGYSFACLVVVALAEGNTAEARAHLAEGLTAARASGDRPSAANLLEFAARVCLAEGRPKDAARALGAAERLREETNVVRGRIERPGYEADLAAIRAALSPREFDDAWAAGGALSWEQAAAEALIPPGSPDGGGP